MSEASPLDARYMEQVFARMKQQEAQRAAKKASLEANVPSKSGLSDKASGKRPAKDLGDGPKWVDTFTQDQYNELGEQMTKLKSDHNDKEFEWQRKLDALREKHEEEMTDAVANKVVEALTAQSAKRGESLDIINEAMIIVENVLKAKGTGHQKLARGLVCGLNPNLVTRQTLRRVCRTFNDLYNLLEVNFSATLPDTALLEKDSLSKERLAEYFRVNLCSYAGSCNVEAEEEFCTSAFGMKLYKGNGLRMYLTEEGVAASVKNNALGAGRWDLM